MEVKFMTKEESNKLRQEEFLKLSQTERMMSFFSFQEGFISSQPELVPIQDRIILF